MSKVYLVGAGPGDPGLITWKGKRLLEQADVVLFDHLANESLLDLTHAHCERIYVGKKASSHSHSQEEICELLIERGRRGLKVVRLKGGDPFIFGRGGEEIESLAAAGVPYEVVPGVTSPLGIAAYTGVPLTHRDHTSVVTFVTGHDTAAIDWSRVGQAETLVVFMGLTSIREIAKQIVSQGRAAETPAMAVRWGTRPNQETIVGMLGDIADRVELARMKPPATIIIGDVVGLRDRLSWFEKLPLFGQRVVVTRAAEQAPELAESLRALGADVIEMPVIALRPPLDCGPLDRAIAELEQYDWLIFTSVNGVRFFLDRLDGSSRDLRSLRARIWTIGPATQAAVEALHLKVDQAPSDVAGKRILLPRAAVARDVIPDELVRMGARVDVVEAYRNVLPEGVPPLRSKPDWVTFTSSSTVKNFLTLVGREAFEGAKIASIGPQTSDTIRMHGLKVDAEARTQTMDGLLDAVLFGNGVYGPATA